MANHWRAACVVISNMTHEPIAEEFEGVSVDLDVARIASRLKTFHSPEQRLMTSDMGRHICVTTSSQELFFIVEVLLGVGDKLSEDVVDYFFTTIGDEGVEHLIDVDHQPHVLPVYVGHAGLVNRAPLKNAHGQIPG